MLWRSRRQEKRRRGQRERRSALGPTWQPRHAHHLGHDVHGGAGQHILHGHRGLPIRLSFQNLHQLLSFLIERLHQADQGAGETAHGSAATRTSPGLQPHWPLLWMDPACRAEAAALPSLSDLPSRPGSQGGVAVTNLSPGVAPFHSGWALSLCPRLLFHGASVCSWAPQL